MKIIKQLKDNNDSRRKLLYLDQTGKKFYNEIFQSQKKRIFNALKNSDSDSVIKFKQVLEKIINGKNKYHILVVDDDDKIKELIKQFLVDKGLIVSTASNADEAKEKLEIFNFNLIVLDVMMPGQSGYELTKELKASKNIPIILLTAKGEPENRIHGLEIGADDYLGKPFEPKELLLRIKNIIRSNFNEKFI